MRISMLPAATLFAAPLFAEYMADPGVRAERALFEATVDERPFQRLQTPGEGRPAWPVGVMLRALVLQRRHGWHDRGLVQQLRDNNRIRVIVGLPLGLRSAPSRAAVIGFRKQVVTAGLEVELFGQQAQAIADSGLVRPEQDDFVVDTTRLEAAAAQPTWVGLLEHGIRRVLLAMRDLDAEQAEATAKGVGVEAWLKPRFNRWSGGLQTRAGRRRWARCYRRAQRLLKTVEKDRSAHADLEHAACVLERILAERGPDGSGRARDRLTNVMDEDARFGRKGHGPHKITWNGYKTGLLTHVPSDLVVALDVVAGNAADRAVLVPTVEEVAAAHGDVPATVHGDHAFADRQSRRNLAERGSALVGPRVGRRRRGRVPGGGRVARRQDRAIRVHVERAVARVVRFRDHRRCWYLGAAKAELQTALSVVADNFVRLLTLLRSGRVQLRDGRLVATG